MFDVKIIFFQIIIGLQVSHNLRHSDTALITHVGSNRYTLAAFGVPQAPWRILGGKKVGEAGGASIGAPGSAAGGNQGDDGDGREGVGEGSGIGNEEGA